MNINIIEIELSSLCNAKCSACMRTILDERGKYYYKGNLPLDDIMDWFDPLDISNTKIKTDKANFRPIDIPKLKGDYSKAKKKLKWKPKTTFKKLVKIMVEEDVNRWQKFLKKESQPWDLYHHK